MLRNLSYRRKIVLVSAVVVAALVGFLLFRPDKAFVDDRVNEGLSEAFPTATTAVAPPGASSSLADELSPQSVNTGSFVGLAHEASGQAGVYQQDGAYVLRFEDNTMIFNGPDLYVWLLEADSFEEGSQPTSYLDLGKLKGNEGGQNYQLPADYDPGKHKAVLIWCLRFGVPFAVAPLS